MSDQEDQQKLRERLPDWKLAELGLWTPDGAGPAPDYPGPKGPAGKFRVSPKITGEE